MKSNVCKIEKGTKDLDAILKESEKVAVYNELDHKSTMQLRLICEELDGMLPELIGDFEGEFWIDFEGDLCKVNASIEIDDLSLENKELLIGIAKNKKNAAAVGIVGRIRVAMENFFLDTDMAESLALSSGAYSVSTGYYSDMDYSYYWTLNQYKNAVLEKKEEAGEEWDELERSVIASVADDIIVGIKGKRADITVIKTFA